MRTRVFGALLMLGVVVMPSGPAAAVPGDPVVTPGRGSSITTVIDDPGAPGRSVAGVPVKKVAGSGGGGVAPPVVRFADGSYSVDTGVGGAGSGDCFYERVSELDEPGPPVRTAYRRSCDEATLAAETGTIIFRGPGAPPPVQVTPAQLAQRAVGELVLPSPVVRRSPVETNEYEGDPFTWANLWTWFWTDPSAFGPLTQTTSLGPVSATVTARPVGLVFDPGDGGEVVRCAGPGVAWSEVFGNDEPPTGCGYRYRGVTDGPVTTSLGIVWKVSWTGSGGAGGSLPAMTTTTSAPLRVLQVQVVNR